MSKVTYVKFDEDNCPKCGGSLTQLCNTKMCDNCNAVFTVVYTDVEHVVNAHSDNEGMFDIE